MRLTQEELAYVRSKALYVMEECDAYGEALNQSFRYFLWASFRHSRNAPNSSL